MNPEESNQYIPIGLPDRFNYPTSKSLLLAQEFLKLMKKRHSTRDFSEQPVSFEIIKTCIEAAGQSPSGANHQPWYFATISNSVLKRQIRLAAEAEETDFYDGAAGSEWLQALAPLGTDSSKPHLEEAPWLIAVFAQRWGELADGRRFKNYYVMESVGIATGVLITALHNSGLCCLTHTPNPMKFLNVLLNRPVSEKPFLLLAVGHPKNDAKVPSIAKIKKSLDQIFELFA